VLRTENRRRSLTQSGLFAAPLVVLVSVSWAHRCIVDDGFIYLRVVRQVTSGHGPVFNRGERVEAFTGPLWLAVLTVADLLTPVRLEWIAVGLGIICTTAGMALVMLGAGRLARLHSPDALQVPVGVLVLLALVPMWFYASSGLETGLVFLWLGACLWILAKWSHSELDRLSLTKLVVLGLGWLVRPELLVYSIVFLVMVMAVQWRRQGWRGRARVVGTALALPAMYQIFRMGYYGALVANTAIAKEGTHLRWDRGLRYLRDFVGPYWLWIPLLLLAVGVYLPLVLGLYHSRRRRALAVVAAFVTAGVLNALYVVMVGGDYEHARLLLPALFAVCAPVAVAPLTRSHLVAAAIVPWAIAAAFARPPSYSNFFAKGFVFPAQRSGRVTLEDYGWGPGGRNRRWYTRPALYIERDGFSANYERIDVPVLPSVRRPAVVIGGIGIVGYSLGGDVYVLDLLGLADTFTAHLDAPTRSLRPPGHEKPLPAAWWVARLFPPGVLPPDLPDIGKSSKSLIPLTVGSEFRRQVTLARAVLTCGPVEKLTRSATEALTPRRFLANLVDSFENNFTRIPPDPAQAFRSLCGARAPPTRDRSMSK
jgi:arabinofuranosyltransferase